jgi:hypothetical protein
MPIKLLAVVFLFLSGVAASNVESFGQGLCIYEYFSQGTVTYYSELQGSASDDLAMIKVCGILAVIFSIIIFLPLIAVRIKIIYAFMLILLLVAELIILNMIEAVPYKEVIYDSIVYCSNYAMIVWIICKIFFLISSGYYLFKYEEY